MNEELIRQLVLQLLENQEIQSLIKQSTHGAELPKGLVLLEGGKEREDLLREWVLRWRPKYRLFLLLKDNHWQNIPHFQEVGNLPPGVSSISSSEAGGRKGWSHIFIPDCSADTLAKAALGIQDTPFTELIGRGISEGVAITLSTYYLGLSAKTPEPYRKMFQDYIQKLRQFGVQILVTPKEIPIRHFAKRLLTDQDAFSIPEKTILQLSKETIISPLAKDTLKRKQIQLRVETEDEI